MKPLISIFLSLTVGLFIYWAYHQYLTGMNLFLSYFAIAILIILLILNCLMIFKSNNIRVTFDHFFSPST